MNNTENNLLQRLGNAIYALMLAGALLLLLVAFFLFKDNPVWQSFSLNLAAGLVQVTLVYYLVERVFGFNPKRHEEHTLARLVTQLEKNISRAQSDVAVFPHRMSIYQTAIETVKAEHWKEIRIFAPVGFWREDEYKTAWLQELASQAAKGGVETVSAVYGLPPKELDGKPIPKEEVLRNLANARKVLGYFDGQKNVSIRFYPPTQASVGFGALIFQSNNREGQTAFALCSHTHEDLIDNGFATYNADVFMNALEWFDKRIFHTAVRSFVLQDERRSISQTWSNVVEAWYGKDYLQA